MKLTWLSHSAFRLEVGTSVVLVDPFLSQNPKFGESGLAMDAVREGATHILVTHGHGDHVGDTVDIAKATGAKVVTNYDLCMFFASQGVESFDPMNTGGTVDQGDFKVALVRADHSAGLVEMNVNFPLGNANGIVVTPKDGPAILFMGDTDIFSDMALINEIYRPKIGVVPIGDRFTMGPETAAMACNEFLDLEVIVPIHWGTFDLRTGDPEAFAKLVRRGRVARPAPGEPLDL